MADEHAMHVALVAADREVWSGEAIVVNARTADGEIGVLPNHTPVLSVLRAGQIDVRTENDGHWVAAIDGGFLSVANNQVRSCASASRSRSREQLRARRSASWTRRSPPKAAGPTRQSPSTDKAD